MKIDDEIKKALEVLRNGGTILYPTDTVWGLGCDATNKKAVNKIFDLKKRAESKSLIILLDSINRLNEYVEFIPDTLPDLLSQFDRPTTIIYSQAKNLAKNALPPEKTVAIRIVKHDFCQRLIEEFGKPIVSTSANISGDPTPMYYNQISIPIKQGVDHVVALEQDIISGVKPSTIIKLEEDGFFNVIRP